jgi:hypothetical protein
MIQQYTNMQDCDNDHGEQDEQQSQDDRAQEKLAARAGAEDAPAADSQVEHGTKKALWILSGLLLVASTCGLTWCAAREFLCELSGQLMLADRACFFLFENWALFSPQNREMHSEPRTFCCLYFIQCRKCTASIIWIASCYMIRPLNTPTHHRHTDATYVYPCALI